MNIVLVHGWGHDASVWNAVHARLDPALSVTTLDFGYFGAVPPAPTFAGPVIAVGHSLGALWWLTQHDIPWRRLLMVNGFPRFTTTDGYPGVAPRVLDRMRKQFANAPAEVLADFHARCGAPGPSPGTDVARLAQGLAQLAELDGRAALAARGDDVWALAGTDDPIVPHAMSAAAFAALPAGHCEWIDAPGHLLPLTHPGLCAQWIERLAA
jgi:pimeloyl-[acyl-carrier protein] methyl ester esterase